MKQMYRFARYLACAGLIAGTLSLWGCGSASTYDPITPTRIVAFGDALVDVGQVGRVDANNNNTAYRFTVNQDRVGTTLPNTGNTFIEMIVSYFGFGSVTYALDSLTAGRLPSTGAFSYGEYGALVSGAAVFGAGTTEPFPGTQQATDARGCRKVAATKALREALPVNVDERYCAYSLQAQIDLFLAQGTPSSNDLFVISIGTGDIMAAGIRGLTINAAGVTAGLDDVQTLLAAAGINTQVKAAADALAVQVKRLTDAGAKYVLVVNPPNVGRSPWAATTGNAAMIETLSSSMNAAALASIYKVYGSQSPQPIRNLEILGTVNVMTDSNSFIFANKTTPACTATTNTSTRATAISIGTGLKPTAALGAVPAGQLSAALCTTATLGGDSSTYVYADGVNFTSTMQSQFYAAALARMRLGWIN